jgi:hypothetical protein
MEPRARVVEAAAARFRRLGEASPAAPELVEAARYKKETVSIESHQTVGLQIVIETKPLGRDNVRLASLGRRENDSRAVRNSWPTLVMVVAPFRSPLRACVERKQDLASMIGKMYLDCSRIRNQEGEERWISVQQSQRLKRLTIIPKS